MARLLRLILGMALALSMGLSVAAHADEQICLPMTEASASAGHSDGDADQVPADADQGYPHHHGGCHGHHVATPLDKVAHGPRPMARERHVVAIAMAIDGGTDDPALRPPIA